MKIIKINLSILLILGLQRLQQQRLLYFNSANLNATHPQNYNEVVEPLASRKRPYLLDHIGEGMNLFSKKTNRQ